MNHKEKYFIGDKLKLRDNNSKFPCECNIYELYTNGIAVIFPDGVKCEYFYETIDKLYINYSHNKRLKESRNKKINSIIN